MEAVQRHAEVHVSGSFRKVSAGLRRELCRCLGIACSRAEHRSRWETLVCLQWSPLMKLCILLTAEGDYSESPGRHENMWVVWACMYALVCSCEGLNKPEGKEDLGLFHLHQI